MTRRDEGSPKVRHLNCGSMHAPPYDPAVCHCLLLEGRDGLVLVDAGVGLLDVRRPDERLGRELIEIVGFKLDEAETAVRQIERLGYRPEDVTDVLLTHADPDHTGGLSDFPHARVHISAEEHAALGRGRWRYLPTHFAHDPLWATYPASGREWFGLEACPVGLGLGAEVLFVPLPGHTLGHCGVAIRQGDRWLLHAGDAYYLRVELERDDHPVSALTAQRADDDALRRTSLEQIRRLVREHGDEVTVFGYHDPEEMPAEESPVG